MQLDEFVFTVKTLVLRSAVVSMLKSVFGRLFIVIDFEPVISSAPLDFDENLTV